LFGLTTSTFVNNKVIFQKKNEFSTSRSRWLVTFVIEFQVYFDFINAIEKDVKSTYLISKETKVWLQKTSCEENRTI